MGIDEHYVATDMDKVGSLWAAVRCHENLRPWWFVGRLYYNWEFAHHFSFQSWCWDFVGAERSRHGKSTQRVVSDLVITIPGFCAFCSFALELGAFCWRSGSSLDESWWRTCFSQPSPFSPDWRCAWQNNSPNQTKLLNSSPKPSEGLPHGLKISARMFLKENLHRSW